MSDAAEKVIDAVGLYCPEPVFQVKIGMEQMQVGQILQISADDPAAEDDITRWASRNGHDLLGVSKDGRTVTIRIKKTK